jgi:hypothetical protein
MTPGIQEKVWLAAVAVMGAFLLHLGYDWYSATRAEAQCKRNLQTIQAALERYSSEKRYYPEHLQQLVDAGYLTSLPRNPYARGAKLQSKAGLMREIEGEAPEPGGVAYLPSNGYQSNCYLLAVYGDERARKAGRTMAGQSLNLDPGLAAKAAQVAWDRTLLMLQGKGR